MKNDLYGKMKLVCAVAVEKDIIKTSEKKIKTESLLKTPKGILNSVIIEEELAGFII